MNRLAFETSGAYCSVALDANGEVRVRQQHSQRGHAELLLPWVDQLLAEAGLRYGDLDALAVSQGPGSFTSLRIGLGMMQGIALAHDLPIHAVSSLDVVAEAYDPSAKVGRLMAIMDARMHELYVAQYAVSEGARLRLVDPYLTTLETLKASNTDQPWVLVGSGADAYEAALLAQLQPAQARVVTGVWPTAEAVLRLAEHVQPSPAWSLEPAYLRHRVTH